MDLYRTLDNLSKQVAASGSIDVSKDPEPIRDRNWMTAFFGFEDTGATSIFRESATNADRTIVIKTILRSYAVYNPENGKLRTSGGNYEAGWFIHPTVKEIKELVGRLKADGGKPNIVVVKGKDIGVAQIESPPYHTFQGASQLNALEMVNPNKTPFDGISDYISDGTQGPRTALACAPGTFVRNYWVTQEYGDQFNALEQLNISHLNGYLIWGTIPQEMRPIVSKSDDVMIPCMIHTQVAGITVDKNNLRRHEEPKRIHQIYSSAAPVNAYRNGGNIEIQLKVARALIFAEYVGTIGMGIALHEFDKAAGLAVSERPQINLTLIGAGVFNVPEDDVINQIKSAVDVYPNRSFDLYIHGYSSTTADNISKILGVPILGVPEVQPTVQQLIQPTVQPTVQQLIQPTVQLTFQQSAQPTIQQPAQQQPIPIGQMLPKTIDEVKSRFLITIPNKEDPSRVKFYHPRSDQAEWLFKFIGSGRNIMNVDTPIFKAIFYVFVLDGQTIYGFSNEKNETRYFLDTYGKNIRLGGANQDGSIIVIRDNKIVTSYP